MTKALAYGNDMRLVAADHAEHLCGFLLQPALPAADPEHLVSNHIRPLPIPSSLCKSLFPLVVACVEEPLGTL